MSTILFVAGTGTGVGKTTFAVALLRSLRARGVNAHGWKPIESGGDSDFQALAAAGSTWLPPRHRLRDAVSPHLAARRQRERIDIRDVAAACAQFAEPCEILVVETAGGLFTPLDDEGATNADLIACAKGAQWILVATNRLGVLHDVGAATRAARPMRPLAVVLSGNASDASTDSNAEELSRSHQVLSMPSPELSQRTTDVIVDLLRRQEPTSPAP